MFVTFVVSAVFCLVSVMLGHHHWKHGKDDRADMWMFVISLLILSSVTFVYLLEAILILIKGR